MAEKPILFSGEMIRAILDGRKTQTRRVIKDKTFYFGDFAVQLQRMSKNDMSLVTGNDFIKCPYGQVGDFLWVRETWACIGAEHVKPSKIAPGYSVNYKADNDPENWRVEKWRPSIFMPRWASRITLKITNVRVERVQDISQDDAKAEGIARNWLGADCPPEYENEWMNYTPNDEEGFPCYSPTESFQTLWDSINEKRGFGWDVNPWVWVVEFEKTEVSE